MSYGGRNQNNCAIQDSPAAGTVEVIPLPKIVHAAGAVEIIAPPKKVHATTRRLADVTDEEDTVDTADPRRMST
jgi:hypothetical protein